MISNASVPVAGWKENHVPAEQQRSISLSAGRLGLRRKAGAPRPSLAADLNVSDDACMGFKANQDALLLPSKSQGMRLDFQSEYVVQHCLHQMR